MKVKVLSFYVYQHYQNYLSFFTFLVFFFLNKIGKQKRFL